MKAGTTKKGYDPSPSCGGVLRDLALRCAAVLFLASFGSVAESQASERLAIVTTTTDLQSLAQAVGGDRVTVDSIVPPGADAEEYQPKPQDFARLKAARLLVRVGLDFDLWVERLVASAGRNELARGQPGHVDASLGITILDVHAHGVGPGDGHAHGSGNPHYWLDPRNAEIITGFIFERLADLDPANAKGYEANRQQFLERLDAKISGWEAKLAGLKGQPIVAYHNTWPYFARRFRLNIVAVIEQKPGVPPSPAQLNRLIGVMQQTGARLIVRERQDAERIATFLAGKTGAQVVLLAGSVGAVPQAHDYFAMFDWNVAALLAAMKTE